MLIIRTLHVENESFDVLRSFYCFHRRTDLKGRPETGLLGGEFIIILESDKNSYLHRLLLRNTPFSGSLEYRNGDGEIVCNYVWEKAYIYSIEESMDILLNQPMTLTVSITPLRMDINRLVRLDRRTPQTYGFWWEEYKEEEVKQAPVEQEEDEEEKEKKITKLYWIDVETKEEIETIASNQKAYLCFETQGYKKGEPVKAKVKWSNNQKFANNSTELTFSGVVDENGKAISKEIYEMNENNN